MDKDKDHPDKFDQGEDPAPGSADERYSAEAEAAFDKILQDVLAAKKKKK